MTIYWLFVASRRIRRWLTDLQPVALTAARRREFSRDE